MKKMMILVVAALIASCNQLPVIFDNDGEVVGYYVLDNTSLSALIAEQQAKGKMKNDNDPIANGLASMASGMFINTITGSLKLNEDHTGVYLVSFFGQGESDTIQWKSKGEDIQFTMKGKKQKVKAKYKNGMLQVFMKKGIDTPLIFMKKY